MNQTRITAIHPRQAVEGGRVSIHGVGFPIDQPRLPEVSLSDRAVRVVCASATCLDVIVPSGFPLGGSFAVGIDGETSDAAVIDVARPIATELHQVDSPVCDRDGNVYVTFSGRRGQHVPVSIFRITPNGTREALSSGVTNATSMAFDRAGRLYVSSRFEGTVYRLDENGTPKVFATDLGVPCGLVFDHEGTLYVGDRSGTIFKVDSDGRTSALATLPPSVAAFHLAKGPDAAVYVTGPTLASRDAVYRVGFDGKVTTLSDAFGRPQGLAFDASGTLFVVDALAGASGVYRLQQDREPELVVAGVNLIGVAFGSDGALYTCSSDTVFKFQAARASGDGPAHTPDS